MIAMKELLNIIPQKGKVEWIGIRPVKRGPVKHVEEIKITAETGIEGDHYSKEEGKRMVTLIQKEHIDVVSGILDQPIDPASIRRNIVVSGINLLSLHKRHVSIGKGVLLEVTGYCHPCSRMEENLGAGGYNAMRGHGGLTAKVIKGGKVRLNDEVGLKIEHPSEQLTDMTV